MKFVIAVAFFIASTRALPQSERIPIDFRDERSVSGNIISAIEDVCQSIRDAGLDPLHIKKQAAGYELPVPVLFSGAAYIEDILSNGLSNVVVNSVSYSLITSRLNFDIGMPLIDFAIDTASSEAIIFGNKFKAETSGKVEIQRISVVGQVRVSIGIISGITIRSVTVNFNLGSINSDVKLVIQDVDYSNNVNKFLGTTVPNTLKEYSSEINDLLAILLKDIISEII